MTLLVSVEKLSKAYGSRMLFEDISFSLRTGDRLGLAGPNGSGKSTLVKILAGLEKPDEGVVCKRQGLRVAYAAQNPLFPSKTAKEVLCMVSPLPQEEAELKADILLSQAAFPDSLAFADQLSGGWKKRLDILRVFMQEPDLLLFDEPTNHLDLEGIFWLEKLLNKDKTPSLIVSHDRMFLDRTVNRMVELNRCFPKGTFCVEGGWSVFCEKRQAFLEEQLQKERSLSQHVKEEVDWMRRSPKARTTKSKSRMQRGREAIEELAVLEKRNTQSEVGLTFSASQRETRHLIVVNNLKKEREGRVLFSGLDLKLSPGTRLGVVGRNGSGKTTLLKILAGEVAHDQGTVKYAEDLKWVYFDQHRETIEEGVTVREALSPCGEFVRFQGQEIHVNGWGKKFLFSPDRLNSPIDCLSGGERARILLARLMLKPADVLFLDEPTNDLDVQTLEVMERSLLEFPGAVVLITHDRFLMDRVCTEILGLGEGLEERVFADFTQWERASSQESGKRKEERKEKTFKRPVSPLSYKEKKELEGMEACIEKEEGALALVQRQVEEEQESKRLLALYEEMAILQQKIETLYIRWQVLLDKLKE